MLNKSHNHNQSGFTLIELLLYVAILSVIMASIIFVAISTVTQRVRNQAVAEVNYQGEAIMNQMTQSIRNSSTLNTPTIGNSGSSLSVNTVVAANNPTVYASVNDGARNRIRITEGSTNNYLTNNKVTISGLSFSNVAISGSRDSIKIQYTISAYNPSNRPELNYQKTFYGSATLR